MKPILIDLSGTKERPEVKNPGIPVLRSEGLTIERVGETFVIGSLADKASDLLGFRCG
jgi:hypothetical protein